MKRSIRHAALIATTAAVVIGAPTAAFAGTRARSTCTESFARWHTDLEQPEGGYVTIDFGRDGVDFTTTIWQSAMVGVGGPYKGETIRVIWYAADGTKLGEKGNGVEVEVDNCSPTIDVIPSEAPPTTSASSPTEAPVVATQPAPVTTQPASVTTEAAPVVTEPATVPATVAIVHADLPATTTAPAAVPATVAAVLPATGTTQRAAVLAGMIALFGGFILVGTSRRRTVPATGHRPSQG